LNHAFKGIAVGAAGEYRVRFRYWPKNFPRNLTLAGLGAVLAAASLFGGMRRRIEVSRRDERVPPRAIEPSRLA
jgi:hypothetical protein